MAKISTPTVMSLVLWLAISVGSWAESWEEWTQKGLGVNQRNEVEDGSKAPTEEEVAAFLNVLQGAKIALEADKFQTALAMVVGVITRLDATNLPDQEKAAKFKEMLPIIEDAVEHDNKAKAIALINTLQQEFKQKKEGNEQGGELRNRVLLELEEMQRRKQTLEKNLGEIFMAMKAHQKDKAAELLQQVWELVKNNEYLTKEGKGPAFLEAVHEAEVLVRKDAMDDAEKVLQRVMSDLGAHHPENLDDDTSKKVIEIFVNQALKAIEAKEKEKAENSLTQVIEGLNKHKTDKKAAQLIPAIEETQKLVKEGAMDKAQQVLQSAMEDAKIRKDEEEGKTLDDDTSKKVVEVLVNQALKAIEAKEKEKAENSLTRVIEGLQKHKTDKKAAQLIPAIEETQKYVKVGAMDKAQHVLQRAMEDAKKRKDEEEGKTLDDDTSKKVVEILVNQAVKAIQAKEKEKADELLTKIIEGLNKHKGDQKAAQLIPDIEETQKYVKKGAMDKAQQVLQRAVEDAKKRKEEDATKLPTNRKTGSHGKEL